MAHKYTSTFDKNVAININRKINEDQLVKNPKHNMDTINYTSSEETYVKKNGGIGKYTIYRFSAINAEDFKQLYLNIKNSVPVDQLWDLIKDL